MDTDKVIAFASAYAYDEKSRLACIGAVTAAVASLGDVDGEGYDQAALDAASREVHMMLLREGSSWGTKACEEMGRVFMTAYRKARRDNSARQD